MDTVEIALLIDNQNNQNFDFFTEMLHHKCSSSTFVFVDVTKSRIAKSKKALKSIQFEFL